LALGGSTGSVLAALESIADRVPTGSRVVALSPDMGDRYVKTIYDDMWVADTFGTGVLDDSARRSVAV
jgi:cysteine synthase A